MNKFNSKFYRYFRRNELDRAVMQTEAEKRAMGFTTLSYANEHSYTRRYFIKYCGSLRHWLQAREYEMPQIMPKMQSDFL